MDPPRRLWAHDVVGRVRHDVLRRDRDPRGARAGGGGVGRRHRVARGPGPVRRRPGRRSAGLRDLLALRRRAVADPLRGGLPRMTRAALAGLALILTPRSASACATCISSPFGDQSYNWPYLGLILLPFGLIVGIVGIFGYLHLQRLASFVGAKDDHQIIKETT